MVILAKSWFRPMATVEFDVRGLPTGAYAVSGRLAGFVTINRSDVNIVAGRATRLDLTMEIGGVVEDYDTIVVNPRLVHRWVAAVVHLRVVESLIASLKAGRPTTEIAPQSSRLSNLTRKNLDLLGELHRRPMTLRLSPHCGFFKVTRARFFTVTGL